MTTRDTTLEIAARYRARAHAFERRVAAVQPHQWESQSPCEEWTARDVVGHVVEMHEGMLRPLGRGPRPPYRRIHAPTHFEGPMVIEGMGVTHL